MAYATIEDLQARLTQTLTEEEAAVCETLLEDAAVIIDTRAASAPDNVKLVVSCRMVARAIMDDSGIPVGASQGSMSGLGYSQSWTIGTGGSVGELYLSKADKNMLGISNLIGSHSPLEDMTCSREQT